MKLRILHTKLNLPIELTDIANHEDIEWLLIDKAAIDRNEIIEFDAVFYDLRQPVSSQISNWLSSFVSLKTIILFVEDSKTLNRYTQEWPTAEILYSKPADRLLPTWQTIIARLKQRQNYLIDNKAKELELSKNQASIDKITQELEDSFLKTFDLAYTDQITGLPNRPALLQFLDSLLSPNSSNTQKNALLLLHIRNLANIRSSVRFETGNQILRTLVDRLQNNLSRDAFLSLYREDQFGIVLPTEDILTTVKELISILEKPVEANCIEYILSCWAGIAVAPDDANETEALIQGSEIALRAAREAGHEKVHLFSTEDRQRLHYRIKVETELLKPQITDEMYLVYQPIVDAISQKIRFLEVLIRWQSPTLGNVPPSLFIPIAEKLGVIIPLTNWILKETTKVIGLLPPDVKLSVNISPIHLLSPTLSDDLIYLLNQGKTNPSRYKIEITEGVFIDDSNEAIERIRSLKKSGFSIALDDFGVGFSGLSYLGSLPIDSIKIDRSFLLEYPSSDKSRALVDSILALTHVFALDSIAEGVEEQAQLESLRQHGCSMIQGYLLYQPLKEKSMLELFQNISIN